MVHPSPAEIQQMVQEEALTPLGSSLAGAIVTTIIYFGYFCLAVYSFIATKYSWYDVVIISTGFRAVAMACRAAYIVQYSPGLQGTFLAFFNAGWSASGAAVWLTLGAWFKHKGVRIFSERGEKVARFTCYLATIPILAFGPILGVVAAGLIYGAWRTAPHASFLGGPCRRATTYGILGVFILQFLWTLFLYIRITMVLKSKKRKAVPQGDVPSPFSTGKNPKLIWILLITVLFNLIRGCTGVVALYKSKEFVWADDTYFYPLDVLPDFLVLSILCWPKLLARISCAYPPQEEGNRSGSDKEAGQQSNIEDSKS